MMFSKEHIPKRVDESLVNITSACAILTALRSEVTPKADDSLAFINALDSAHKHLLSAFNILIENGAESSDEDQLVKILHLASPGGYCDVCGWDQDDFLPRSNHSELLFKNWDDPCLPE